MLTLGTVVKRKRGTLLADLARPGDEVLVARGGQGGVSQHALNGVKTSGEKKQSFVYFSSDSELLAIGKIVPIYITDYSLFSKLLCKWYFQFAFYIYIFLGFCGRLAW